METISFEVEPEIARAYQNSSSTERKKIQMTFNVLVKQIMNTLFFHGPAGSGKSYLAERLNGLLSGAIALPHAVMVDGEVLPSSTPCCTPCRTRGPCRPTRAGCARSVPPC